MANTREAFLSALANIDTFLIRATYYESMAFARLQDLSLDTAVPGQTGQAVATVVEACQCPAGYTGLSCQVREKKNNQIILKFINGKLCFSNNTL